MNEYKKIPVGACCPPEDDSQDLLPIEGKQAEAELAELSRGLAHPARVRILRLLVSRGASLCGEIVSELPLAQSTVSQHLKILKECGWVRGDIDGPRVCYCISGKALRRFEALAGGLGSFDESSSREN